MNERNSTKRTSWSDIPYRLVTKLVKVLLLPIVSDDGLSPRPPYVTTLLVHLFFCLSFKNYSSIVTLFQRYLIFRPLRLLMEAFIDTLADDDTEDVGKYAASSLTMMKIIPTNEGPFNTSISTAAANRTKAMSTLGEAQPVGNRWAIACSLTNLTGDWELIVTDDFRKQYDNYLLGLGQAGLVRSVALGIVAQTTEKVVQTDQGRSLQIVGRNIRGTWSRILVASGTDLDHDVYLPQLVPITSADSEPVETESWWENNGTVHVSWMRGVTKYGGGSFESRRYLDGEGQEYVCDSAFHPTETSKQPNKITWRFRRQQASS
jgi:hypothetical protein